MTKNVIVPDKQKGNDGLNQYLKNQKERVKILKKIISKLNIINHSNYKKQKI